MTLGLFVGLRGLIGVYLRLDYMASITKLFPPVGSSSTPPGAWVLATSFVNGHGQNLGVGFPLLDIPAQCRAALLKGSDVSGRCLTSHGFHQSSRTSPTAGSGLFRASKPLCSSCLPWLDRLRLVVDAQPRRLVDANRRKDLKHLYRPKRRIAVAPSET